MGRIDEKTTYAPESLSHSQGSVIFLDTPQTAPDCIVNDYVKQQQWRTATGLYKA